MAAEPSIVVGILDFGSGAHWLIILFVALLLFGRKLPEIMKNLGGSIREFKKGMDEGPPSTPPPPPPPAQPPIPHIDGAVSRPEDQASAPPPAAGEHPASPASPPPAHRSDDPPQHH